MSETQEKRDRRLLGEYQELMEFSERSLLVKVEPAGRNFPPTEYLVTYHCLGYKDSHRRETTTGHKIRITLTAGYPNEPPIFQYESKVWAPTFYSSFTTPEHGGKTIPRFICIGHIGTPQIPLVSFVIGVGHMIQLRRDARGLKPLDTRSLEGADAPEPVLPVEKEAEFGIRILDAPTAGWRSSDDKSKSEQAKESLENLSDQIKFLDP